jgi:hypothetical protein
MTYFQTKNTNLGKFWRVLQRAMLVYFITIWSILRPLGIFCGYFVYFVEFGIFCGIWYILWNLVYFVEFGIFCGIWYILWKFGMFYGYLVYVSRFCMLYQEESGNPAIDNNF